MKKRCRPLQWLVPSHNFAKIISNENQIHQIKTCIYIVCNQHLFCSLSGWVGMTVPRAFVHRAAVHSWSVSGWGAHDQFERYSQSYPRFTCPHKLYYILLPSHTNYTILYNKRNAIGKLWQMEGFYMFLFRGDHTSEPVCAKPRIANFLASASFRSCSFFLAMSSRSSMRRRANAAPGNARKEDTGREVPKSHTTGIGFNTSFLENQHVVWMLMRFIHIRHTHHIWNIELHQK